jgi:hypothetical protein
VTSLVSPETTYVAFPYSSNVWSSPEDNLPHPALSQMSKFCLDATMNLYRQEQLHTSELSSRLLIIGETGYQGLPSTTDLMAEEVKKQFGDLGDRVIKMNRVNFEGGKLLNNTINQVEALGVHHDKVIAVALRYHIPRIANHARRRGIELDLRAAEDILTSKSDLAPYKDYLPLFPRPWQLPSEMMLQVASVLPRADQLVNARTSRRGARMMDIMNDPGTGRPRLRITTCDIRLAEVEDEIRLRQIS